jgi:catechol 2,3-dioxygenase-like lactoylglutathione lyase family enzyme
MASWIGQYCINVTDLEVSVAFYEALGLECTSRTAIDTAGEAIVENLARGGKMQLAQQNDQAGPLDRGNAFWKLYVNTNDIGAIHAAALAAGAEEVMAPVRMEQWPTSVSFVKERDGYLVEFVQRHPWQDGDETTPAWLGQYCINVTDLDTTVAFYETLGLTCTSRTDISGAREAILEHPDKGGKVQLAQQDDQDGPITMGTAMWKLYVNTDDIAGTHAAALAAGHVSVMAPTRMERWPVTIGFVADPDGYQVELVERHPW